LIDCTTTDTNFAGVLLPFRQLFTRVRLSQRGPNARVKQVSFCGLLRCKAVSRYTTVLTSLLARLLKQLARVLFHVGFLRSLARSRVFCPLLRYIWSELRSLEFLQRQRWHTLIPYECFASVDSLRTLLQFFDGLFQSFSGLRLKRVDRLCF